MAYTIDIFSQEFKIYGRHATYIRELTGNFQDGRRSKGAVFPTNMAVIAASPLIGFAFKRKGIKETGNKDNGSYTAVFADQMKKISDVLIRSYRAIILLEGKDRYTAQERLDRAFKYDRNPDRFKECYDIFHSYMLGGIEILYEKLLKDASSDYEIMQNCRHFITEYDELSSQKTLDDIIALCNMAGE